MLFREATIDDIAAMHKVRMSVKENVLNSPNLVTHEDYVRYLTVGGKGWVCEENGEIVGFAVISQNDTNLWALFVNPNFEGKGIGKRLHDLMLHRTFEHSQRTVWLTTEPGTRAESFYRKSGWRDTGLTKTGEIRFEMSYADWTQRHL
jgi:ribosomal protein S18 acetylase RimI-like enzyme